MASSKMFVLMICLAMATNALASPQLSAVSSDASDATTDLQQRCRDTVAQCQTQLLAVVGSNFIFARLLATALVVVNLPLLLNLCVSLVALVTVVIATNLIADLLATLLLLIAVVVKLLTGTITLNVFNTNVNTYQQQCVDNLTTHAEGNLVALNLCLDILAQILVTIRLSIS